VVLDAFRSRVGGVLALALVAVFRIHGFAAHRAAITAVPVARLLVVAVITEFVTLEGFQRTRKRAGNALRVLATAFFAINELLRVIVIVVTTIAAIPVAILVVVVVVTVRVANKTRVPAFGLCFACTTVAFAAKDVLKSAALHSMVGFPVRTGSPKALVLFACLNVFVHFTRAATTIATVIVVQSFTRVGIADSGRRRFGQSKRRDNLRQ
jgi:hypothetical protein